MTVVVGVEHGSAVYMGADSWHGDGDRNFLREGKLFRRTASRGEGEFLIGTCGSARWNQILRYRLEIPDPSGYTETGRDRYMATEFADALRETAEEAGFLRKKNEREQGGTALVGFRGRVYTVWSDFAVLRFDHRYSAVGSGDETALGVLHALLPAADSQGVVEAIDRALEAAATHSPWVAPPFHVERV